MCTCVLYRLSHEHTVRTSDQGSSYQLRRHRGHVTQVLLILKRAATLQFPPELQRGGKWFPCARWPTFAPFAPSVSEARPPESAARKRKKKKSDFANLLMVRALDRVLWVSVTFLFWYVGVHPCKKKKKKEPNQDLPSLICCPKDGTGPQERISRLRFTGLCDNLQ